ncbi:hypothetical protein ACI68E_000630 [Malassezia pachydermatis]|uniref:Uncharacterized protein n=1 Tax=Malassezia pachydermatis TaxID=77020 RepID=A0A0M8MMA5_9BASI|nr:hypothetical protein Malapachy_2451 [Malassezia pachydermatis]KOS15356.1 hypothetical protein Malapachy_2451 [Malassezia pachydermatis]
MLSRWTRSARSVVCTTSVLRPKLRSFSHTAPRPTSPALGSALEQLQSLFQPTSPWVTRLEHAKLAVTAPHPHRVAFVGPPDLTHRLVDVILQEPLDETVMRAIADRPRTPSTRIVFGADVPTAQDTWPSSSSHTLSLPLGWLRGMEVLEWTDLQRDTETYTALLACDAVYFVLDTGALERQEASAAQVLRLAELLSDKPDAMLLVNVDVAQAYGQTAAATWDLAVQTAIQHLPPHLLHRLQETHGMNDVRTPLPGVKFVSTRLAAQARSILPTDGFHEFTRQFQASRFAALHLMLTRHIPPALRAWYVAKTALESVTDAEQMETERLATADGFASVLQTHAKNDMQRVSQRIAPPADGSVHPKPTWQRSGDQSTSLRGLLADSRDAVQETLARSFPWWRLPWRADELRLSLSYVIGRSFGASEETRLAYEAGRLRDVARRQTDYTQEALDQMRQRDTRVAHREALADQTRLDAETLRNALHAFEDRQMGALLHAYCLSEPLVHRRQQLLAPGGPLDRMAMRAQKLVARTMLGLGATYSVCGLGAVAHSSPAVVTVPTTTLGTAIATSSWVPAWTWSSWLSIVEMAPSTAGATALLATALGAWYLQGQWSRLKRAFWRDWDRTAEAAEREQQQNAHDILQALVFGAPLQVSTQLHEQVQTRRLQQASRLSELNRLREKIQALPKPT